MNRQIWLGEQPKEPVFWDHQDRQGTLYGKRSDGVKVVKVGISIPAPSTHIAFQQGKKEYEQEAHSNVRNYHRRVLEAIAGITNNNNDDAKFRLQDNTLLNSNFIPVFAGWSRGVEGSYTTYQMGYLSPAHDTNGMGQRLGTSDQAWADDDYKLVGLIQHGVTSGRLQYYQTNAPSISNDGRKWVSVYRRICSNFNADANDLTINELGQYVGYWTTSLSPDGYILDERTVLDTPYVIEYMKSVRMRYTRELTIPSGVAFIANGASALIAITIGCNNSGADFGEGYRTLKNTSGALVNDESVYGRYNNSGYYIYGAPAGTVTYGSRAGYSDTSINYDDYVLNSPYGEGTGENQLTYSAQDTPTFSYSAGSKTYTAQQSRLLTNNYGSSQNVKNVGLYARLTISATAKYFYTFGKVISTIALASTESLLIIHEFNMTHP